MKICGFSNFSFYSCYYLYSAIYNTVKKFVCLNILVQQKMHGNFPIFFKSFIFKTL